MTSTAEHGDVGPEWREVDGALTARFATGDFSAGVGFVDAIAVAANEADHHPDVDLRYPHVDVRLVSHDVGAVTERDVSLARRISAIAVEQGIAAG